MHQAGYISDRTSKLGVGDTLLGLLLKGCPCGINHIDKLGLSENCRVDLIVIIVKLVI